MPDVKKRIGARAHAMLDAGTKLEVDGLATRMRDPFCDEMRKRLR